MISTKYRTPKDRIEYILKKGQSYNSKLFIIRFIKNQEAFCRFRVIVSKKIHSSSVKRNHLRREIYEAVRTLSPEQNSKLEKKQESTEHYDAILIPKKRVISSKYHDIAQDIQSQILTH